MSLKTHHYKRIFKTGARMCLIHTNEIHNRQLHRPRVQKKNLNSRLVTNLLPCIVNNHDLSNSYSIIIVDLYILTRKRVIVRVWCQTEMSERDELVCAFTLSLSSEWAEERLLRRQFAGFCQEKRSKSKKAKTNRANRATYSQTHNSHPFYM